MFQNTFTRKDTVKKLASPFFFVCASTLSIFFCSFAISVHAKETNQNEKESKKIFSIKVLLEEQNALQKQKIVIAADDGFILRSPVGIESKRAQLLHKKLHLIIKNNTMYVRCKDSAYRRITYDSLSVSPIKGILHYNDKSYHGTIILRLNKKNNKLMLINQLSLDDYIYSVLRSECLSYWPHEMQKVQAIISRTYALYHMKQMKNKHKDNAFYDIKNTNSNQVYNGFHHCVHLKKAVTDTHNVVLTYQGAVAFTEFDICCGGIIPSHMKYKDFDKPYLFRKNQCLFCKGKTHFEWNKNINKQEFINHLKTNPKITKKIEKLGNLLDINVKEKDKAGILHSLVLNGSKKRVTLTGNELKSSISSIKSLTITVTKAKNRVRIKGFGFGHQRGLCQLGARELVARGKKYNEILSYYYPKTKLTCLN